MTIEFLNDIHCYVCDGIIVPSVSDLIGFHFPNAYSGIPEKVLRRKASYGTVVHQTIEAFIRGDKTMDEIRSSRIDPNIKIAVEQFEELRKKWAFQVKDMEQIVSYDGRYAGTYDIRTIDNYIIDLKTTSELHEDWLQWQLSLYYLAAGIKKDNGYCIWLPKGKAAKVVSIECLPEQDLLQLLEEYEKSKTAE